MASLSDGVCDLSALAPRPEVGEAISSWLARTAEAHLLTVIELQHEIGGSIAAFDRGDCTLLPRLACMMQADVEALRSMVLPHFILQPARAGPPPPSCWSVCASCLSEDRAQGRAPYVRSAWTDPLFVYCPIHNAPLVPHGNSPTRVVADEFLFDRKHKSHEPRDATLSRFYFDKPHEVSRIHRELNLSSDEYDAENQGLRYAILDIVDALATNMRTDGSGALVSLLEKPLMNRRSLPGSMGLPQAWWSDVAASYRLLYVRIAFIFVADPRSPWLHYFPSPFGRSWFSRRLCNATDIPWINGAALDPLILLAVELPGPAIGALTFRAVRWTNSLRMRWTYAVAAAALGRYGRGEKSQPIADY